MFNVHANVWFRIWYIAQSLSFGSIMYSLMFDFRFGELLRESCFGSLNKDVNQDQMLYVYPFSLGTWYIIQIEKKHDTYREKYLGLRGSFIDFPHGPLCLEYVTDCRAIWHGAWVIAWALGCCHVYPDPGAKW